MKKSLRLIVLKNILSTKNVSGTHLLILSSEEKLKISNVLLDVKLLEPVMMKLTTFLSIRMTWEKDMACFVINLILKVTLWCVIARNRSVKELLEQKVRMTKNWNALIAIKVCVFSARIFGILIPLAIWIKLRLWKSSDRVIYHSVQYATLK